MSAPKEEAVLNFLSTFGGMVACDVATSLNCGEVEALAELFEAYDMPQEAAMWRRYHAEDDQEGDGHYQGGES